MNFVHEFGAKTRSKEIGLFHDLNQVAKNMFDRYILDRTTGLIFGLSGGMNIDKGTHFGKYLQTPKLMGLFPDEISLIQIEAAQLFALVRDHKKTIIGFSVKDNVINFELEDLGAQPIGSVVEFPKEDEWVSHTVGYAQLVLNKYPTPVLSVEYVDRLMGKQLVIIDHQDMRIRTGKELIPNLANKSEIQVIFEDGWTTPDKFQVIFVHEKLSVITYHIYTCLRY